MKLHFRFSLLAALTVGLLPTVAHCASEVFDWNNITYAPTPAQAVTKTTLTDTAITDNTLSVQYKLTNNATFSTAVTSPTSASSNTNATYYATSGVASQNSLQSVVDFTSSSDSTTETLFFAHPVTNVTFKLFDVDAGTVNGGGYIDIIKSIMGVGFQGGNVSPTSVTGSADNSVTGSGAGFMVTGTASNAQTANMGDVTITFGSFPLSQISFVYGDNYTAGTHSAIQITALGNLTVTTIPEPGTLAWVGMGAAGAIMVARRRRRS